MADLSSWAADTADLTAPKPLQMAKALRQRKRALDQAPNRPALAGTGNVFQRRRAGIDEITNQAVR